MAITHLYNENFADYIQGSELPVLVDFWATWCGPCRMVAPIIAALAEEKQGKIKVGKLNVDEEGPLAAQFGIQAIPTVIKFVGGEPVASATGYMKKEQLEATLGI